MFPQGVQAVPGPGSGTTAGGGESAQAAFPPHIPQGHALIGLLLVLALSAGALTLFLAQSRSFPEFARLVPGHDLYVHWHAARQFRHSPGSPNIEAATMSAPLPLFWLAGTQGVLGEDLWRHRLLHVAIGLVTVALVFALGRDCTGRTAGGVGAAALLAFQPGFVYANTLPLKTTLVLLGFAAGLFLTLRALRSPATGRAALLATAGGLALLAAALAQRFMLAPLAFLAAGLAPWTPRGRWAVALPLAAAVAAFPVLMAGATRVVATDDVLPFWPQTGVHLLVGWHSGADGMYAAVPDLRASPVGHTLEARIVAEHFRDRPLSPAEADRYYRAEAWRTVRDDPGRAAALFWRKLRLSLGAYEPRENVSAEELASRSSLMRLLAPAWGWLVVAAAAGVAACALARRWFELFLLSGLAGAALAGPLLTFVTTRYRLPAAIPLALLGGQAVASLAAAARRPAPAPAPSTGRALTAVLLVAAGLAAVPVAFGSPVADATRRLHAASAAAIWLANDDPEAAERRLATLRSNRDPSRAPTVADLEEEIELLRSLQRHSEALAAARELLRLDPGNPAGMTATVMCLILVGAYDQAAMTARANAERGGLPPELLGNRLPAGWVQSAYWRFVLPLALGKALPAPGPGETEMRGNLDDPPAHPPPIP